MKDSINGAAGTVEAGARSFYLGGDLESNLPEEIAIEDEAHSEDYDGDEF